MATTQVTTTPLMLDNYSNRKTLTSQSLFSPMCSLSMPLLVQNGFALAVHLQFHLLFCFLLWIFVVQHAELVPGECTDRANLQRIGGYLLMFDYFRGHVVTRVERSSHGRRCFFFHCNRPQSAYATTTTTTRPTTATTATPSCSIFQKGSL